MALAAPPGSACPISRLQNVRSPGLLWMSQPNSAGRTPPSPSCGSQAISISAPLMTNSCSVTQRKKYSYAAQRRRKTLSLGFPPQPCVSLLPAANGDGKPARTEQGGSFRREPFMQLSYHYRRISGSFQCPLDPGALNNKA